MWGREKSGFWLNIWLHRMLWTLLRPAAINTIVVRYPAIDRCLLELVLSTDAVVRPVVHHRLSRCKSVYGTESHAPVNTPKRREHNLIYAAVNLTPEYNRRLRLTFCTIEANTDRHEASRDLFATAELHVWSKLTTLSRHLRHCYIISNSQSWTGRPLLP